jgi:hypothetical protein
MSQSQQKGRCKYAGKCMPLVSSVEQKKRRTVVTYTPINYCLHDGMVDITDLKSVAIWRPGSSPGAGTKYYVVKCINNHVVKALIAQLVEQLICNQ